MIAGTRFLHWQKRTGILAMVFMVGRPALAC